MDEFRIAIALWDGVEELDFAGPYEVLTAWSRMSERPISVQTVAPSAEAVRCSHDLRVVPDTTWGDVGKLDLLVLPGQESGRVIVFVDAASGEVVTTLPVDTPAPGSTQRESPAERPPTGPADARTGRSR